MSETSFSAKSVLIAATTLALVACSEEASRTLVTIADARINTAQYIDTGEAGDSVGDILVFDQPLLDKDMKEIGNNSGTCVRSHVGHSFQCQWTLTFENGAIQVAGRELDQGTSTVTIVGGTGKYSGISGEMESTNNNDGTFTQTLHYRTRH
jgi:Allene oxide cyclase barrel like domain